MKFNSQLTQMFNDEIKKKLIKKKLTKKKTELKRPSRKKKKKSLPLPRTLSNKKAEAMM
jgi:hypothetical protein